jgi:hypothetical protein
MKVTGAFVAALAAAAIVFAFEFLIEGLVGGVPLSLVVFVFGVALNLLVGIPAAVIGGVPIWLILRSFRVRSPFAFAVPALRCAPIWCSPQWGWDSPQIAR